ncbi:hypothetical protein QBC39DRAFT_315943 [Podospora conica]|nr:hypothetical protein QBC39DRAFT_315943 [Schizothecium conicum]
MLSMLGGWVRWLANMDDPNSNQAVEVDSDAPRGDYLPTYTDVLVVKCLLAVPHGYSLPPEVVDIIVDHAGYWAHTTSEVKFGDDIHTMKAITQHIEDELLLRTPPLGFPRWPTQTTTTIQPDTIPTHPPTPNPPAEPFPPETFQTLIGAPILAHPCRKIVFTTRSRDQGWGGSRADKGTYNHSWTWFEAGLERWCRRSPSSPEETPTLDLHDLSTQQPRVVTTTDTESAAAFHHDLLPSEGWIVQRNLTAIDEVAEHRVEWSWTDDVADEAGALALAAKGRGKGTGDGVFVRELRLGDVVTVWAKARFPGWVNYVESVKVEVYWAV